MRDFARYAVAPPGCIYRPGATPAIGLLSRLTATDSGSHLLSLRHRSFQRYFTQSRDVRCHTRTFSRGFKTLTAHRPSSRKAPEFAFAFDIDGVLLHVSKPIPGASEALRYLQENDIPFILLTNGGGKHELDRVNDLNSKLGIKLSTENFVQSHTPFQDLVRGPEGLEEKTILVTGADASKCREIAEQYGFKNVVTPADILKAHPDIYPFKRLMKELYEKTARPLPRMDLKFDAVFVFNDPRDWALDIQIILDLLMSREGVLGTWSGKNGNADLSNKGWQGDGQPPIFFSNPDLFWSATWHLPRLGQGAFQAALAGVWSQVTGGIDLQRTVIGKPYAKTYQYAENVLDRHRMEVLGKQKHQKVEPLKRVYMVGDNPESDIRGANEFRSPNGVDWSSVLVRTGVWSPERMEMAHKPKEIVNDVSAAVDWALTQEGWK